MSILNYLRNESVATVSKTAGTYTLTSLAIEEAPTRIAESGQKLVIINRANGLQYSIVLTAALEKGDTTISFSSVTTDSFIINGSVIILPQDEKWDKFTNTFHSRHVTFNFQVDSRTRTRDFFSLPYNDNFTVETNVTIADGSNYDNSWAALYSILNQTGSNFVIHKIRGNVVTDLASGVVTRLQFWKKAFTVGATTQTSMNLVDVKTFTSVADLEHGFEYDSGDISAASNSSFATTDNLIPSISMNTTPGSGTFYVYANMEIIYSNTH
tara:strand:- start:577 stop:1383 length:807 start_codon:yes stop_codon:yes gene_type:complete